MRWPHFLRNGIITSAGNLLGSVSCRSTRGFRIATPSMARQGRAILQNPQQQQEQQQQAAGCEAPEREVTYICVYSERDAAEETISRISL